MSVNQRFAALVPGMLSRHGFAVAIQASTKGAGGDFDDTSETWTTAATVNAVWDTSSQYGSEKLDDGRSQSHTRLGLLIAYRDDLKDAASVANKRILYNGTTYNIAAAQMVGDKVAIRLSLEDGTAQ